MDLFVDMGGLEPLFQIPRPSDGGPRAHCPLNFFHIPPLKIFCAPPAPCERALFGFSGFLTNLCRWVGKTPGPLCGALLGAVLCEVGLSKAIEWHSMATQR